MITFINRLAQFAKTRGGISRRIVNFIDRYCWVRTLGFWMIDLARSDAPWRCFREQQDNLVRWERATLDDCQRWIESGADGFTPSWRGELLIRLIEEKHIMLVGYVNNSKKDDSQIPDCYATLALGYKPMSMQCFFYMESNEGTIRTVYTRTHMRGRGLATRIYAELCCLAEERRLTNVYVDIDFSNIASYRALEKAGGIRMRDMVVYDCTFFKRQYIFVRGSLKNRFRKPLVRYT